MNPHQQSYGQNRQKLNKNSLAKSGDFAVAKTNHIDVTTPFTK